MIETILLLFLAIFVLVDILLVGSFVGKLLKRLRQEQFGTEGWDEEWSDD